MTQVKRDAGPEPVAKIVVPSLTLAGRHDLPPRVLHLLEGVLSKVTSDI